jgi:hypothetical protein
VDSIHLAQGRGQWWAFVNMETNLQDPQKVGNFLINGGTISFSRVTLLHGVS